MKIFIEKYLKRGAPCDVINAKIDSAQICTAVTLSLNFAMNPLHRRCLIEIKIWKHKRNQIILMPKAKSM